MPDSGTLVERLSTRDARIGVVGLGYVGLPLSIEFVGAGFEVAGYDIDETRVGRLEDGDSYVDDVSNDRLESALERGFEPEAEPSVLGGCDAYVIAVPTGVRDGEPDTSAVEDASRTIASRSGDRETLVVVSSTVYPGATEEVVEPIVTAGRDGEPVHLAMVPERLNPGGEFDVSDIPLVVGADSDRAHEAANALFDTIVSEVYPVESIQTAELTKTLENTYRLVNIALVNEFVPLVERTDADLWEAIQAAATKPFGFQPFYPGPGVGGHCIPVDPQFLTWRANEVGTDLSLVERASEINDRMPDRVAGRVEDTLASNGVAVADASLVVLGVAYKPDVGDVRNSPSRRVCERLSDGGATLELVDPHVESVTVGDERYGPVDEIRAGTVRRADAVLVLVDHDSFDYGTLEDAALVFDAVNAVPSNISPVVVSLGDEPLSGPRSEHRRIPSNLD